MKTVTQHTDQELLELTNEQFNDAIRLEAIEAGIKPPIPTAQALERSGWMGYRKPPEHVTVYELAVKEDNYSSLHNSGLGYLSREKALAALEGLIHIDTPYNKINPVMKSGLGVIVEKFVGESPQVEAWAKFQEYVQDDTEFNKIRDVCVDRLSRVRQAAYDARVNAEKKVEYLRLAGGDEAIAQGFWAKVERTPWPS